MSCLERVHNISSSRWLCRTLLTNFASVEVTNDFTDIALQKYYIYSLVSIQCDLHNVIGYSLVPKRQRYASNSFLIILQSHSSSHYWQDCTQTVIAFSYTTQTRTLLIPHHCSTNTVSWTDSRFTFHSSSSPQHSGTDESKDWTMPA